MTVITFSTTNPALLLRIHPSRAPGCGTALGFASAICGNKRDVVTGRCSDTVQLKAVETMGKQEKGSEGKHLFSLPLATSGTFLIIEMLKLAEVAEWVDLVII